MTDCIADRAHWQHWLLGEHPDSSPAAAAHNACLGIEIATDDSQQCALAATVESDDANAIAVADRERHIVEQRSIGSRGAQPLGIDQDHRISRLRVEKINDPNGRQA